MRTAWIGILAASLAANVAAAAPLTPTAVRESVRKEGARRTIDDLSKRGRWDAVTDAMNRGEAAWIALAPLLAPGSDAGSAEDLGISLAFALSKNPRAVLAAIDPRNGVVLGVNRVCGRPFIEDTEPVNYKARTISALSNIREPGLIRVRQDCLKVLRATR